MELKMDELKKEPSLKLFARKLLWNIANELEAVQGAFYVTALNAEGIPVIRFVEGYAYHIPETESLEFEFGDGIAGQVAKDGKPIYLEDIPAGYLTVMSGLGTSSPTHLFTLPIKDNDSVLAVLEIAAFKPISHSLENFINENQSTLVQSITQLSHTHE
jgi:putative methionine-R-sulfoxide reductase with GAF domain